MDDVDVPLTTQLRHVQDRMIALACQVDPADADVYDTVVILLEAAQGLLAGQVTAAVPASIRRLQMELAAAMTPLLVIRVRTA